MSQWNSWFNLPTWLTGTSSEPAQQMVHARTGSLEVNAMQVDKIAQTTKNLRELYGRVREANPSLFNALNVSTEPDVRMMAEQLQIVVLAAASDATDLSENLEAIRQKRELLEQLVASWEKIEQSFDRALATGGNAKQIDTQNVEDLSELLQTLQKLGLPPTCHSGLL